MAVEAESLTMGQWKITVVVASHNARTSIAECLSALVAQRPPEDVEIVVVDNSTDGTTEIIRERFPDLRLIVSPPSTLIPQLWGAGIQQSSGEVVALTTAHCIPDQDWLWQVRKAHAAPAAAIGGVIENVASAGVIDWAIYFCRYSRYMPPVREGVVAEIAGDNASYKRTYLERCQAAWRDGFWEPAVHAELKKAGRSLLLAPSIVISHKKSFRLLSFMRQRFQHGRQFGAWRASCLPSRQRALYIVLSPLIPFVLLARIGQQVLQKGRHCKAFVLSLPVLLLFLAAWTLGELAGYLRGVKVH